MASPVEVIGTPLLIGLALAVASAFLLYFFPTLRHPWPLLAMGLAASVLYFRGTFAAFAVALIAAYPCARWIAAGADAGRRWRRANAMLVLLLSTFLVGRGTATYVLDMWLALRIATLFWEVGSAAVTVPSAVAYGSWACLPLTLAGPLVRYSEYQPVTVPAGMLRRRESWSGLAEGALKLAAGLAVGYAAWWMSVRWPDARVARGAFIALVAGPIGFYLTFAGYYHLMQTLGTIAGLRIPESFNWPIGRANIAAFWANWNITATAVFRDYLFYNRWGFSRYNIFLNTMILFVLVGAWHAVNPYWILWGFLHGVLFCGFLLWRSRRMRSAALPLHGTAASRMAARVFTYLCVCACWYLPTKILNWLRSL